MGLFGGGTKSSQAQGQAESQAAGSILDGSAWTVRKSTKPGADFFNLAVVIAGAYLAYAWHKKHKGR